MTPITLTTTSLKALMDVVATPIDVIILDADGNQLDIGGASLEDYHELVADNKSDALSGMKVIRRTNLVIHLANDTYEKR